MSATRNLIVSADDLGLSKENTDTIFEAVDNGALTSVSILANGPAFLYAIDEYRLRKESLALRVHLNLTEGKPLGHNVSLLVTSDGNFKSLAHLAGTYYLSSRAVRTQIREQVSQELALQMRRVLDTRVAGESLSVDGHQHVHMLPFVFEEIVSLKSVLPIAHIRIPREPFNLASWSPFAYPLSHVIVHLVVGGYFLMFLSVRACEKARRAGIATNEWFVGIRYSGRMTEQTAQSGLRAVVAEGGVGETELLFHPGSVPNDMPLDWSGDCGWHYSPHRTTERMFLMSPEAKVLFNSFRTGTLQAGSNLDKVLRYLVSGGTAAFAHLGTLYLLTEFLGLWYLAANTWAFLLGLVVSFSLQKLWTFKDTRTTGVHHQAFWYALVQMVSLGVDTVGLYLLVEYVHLWYLAAQFMLLVGIAVGNFFIFNKVIFKHHGHS